MAPRKKLAGRRATWLAFGVVALATISASASDIVVENGDAVDNKNTQVPAMEQVTIGHIPASNDPKAADRMAEISQQELDKEAEASRAYKRALATLSSIDLNQGPNMVDPFPNPPGVGTNSILSSVLNLQGQGPIASAYRIITKLQQKPWLRRLTSGIGKESVKASRNRDEEMRGKAIKIIDLLQHSVELGNTDALFELAKLSLFPPNTYFPSNPKLAFSTFMQHIELTGSPRSQAFVAFFHATGYRGVVPIDQAKAQLYYTFAAVGGDKGALMALGYRSWTGIGTSEDCNAALEWYQRASDRAMAKYLTGPPGGRTLTQTPTKLSDLAGGVYGPGASYASTGTNMGKPAVLAGRARAAGETWEDILDYYIFNADRGETEFAFRLGKIFYQGSIYAAPGGIASGSEGVGAIPRDYARARHYFLRIARQVWSRDPPNPLNHVRTPIKDDERIPVGFAAISAGYLGRMFLRGEGVKSDPAMAKMWFERGAEHGDRECLNGLGIIWRDGLIGRVTNMKAALGHFQAAAGQDLAEAEVNLGKYHFDRHEYALASTFFEAAIRHRSPFEAYYYLAEIQALGAHQGEEMVSGSCAIAVSFHKLVAERGLWEDDLLKEAENAWMTGTERGKEVAMAKWWMAAEQGHEVAQNNLAYVLDQDRSILRLTRFSPLTPSNDTARLALTQWTRSAAQYDVDALVKVGDYYYHGLGISEDSEQSRLEKAARYYQSAADTQVSALAMWNLGWMYENGVGVPQDFHLAKRHYDLAMETSEEAYFPVVLSLGKLYIRSIWHTMMGGTGGLKLWGPNKEDIENREGAHGRDAHVKDDMHVDGHGVEVGVDNFDSTDGGENNWYLGKAKEDFRRRKNLPNGEVNGEEDPVQWARERRASSADDRDADFGPEDYSDGALRGGHRGEEKEEFGETVLLLILCAAVSILIYVRTRIRRQQGQTQDQQQQQPEAPRDQGRFPPVGDPARNEWLVAH